jgi:putative membrane protein
MAALSWVFIAAAGLLHVYIFWLESFAWTAPRTRATFGTSPALAEATKPMACNQGWYNFFLAVGAFAAVGFLVTGRADVGLALACASAGSMVAAALVLVTSDASKLRAALIQGTLPAIGLVLLLLSR